MALKGPSSYKIQSFRLAADIVGKLDFTVKHGDELKGVCPISALSCLVVEFSFNPIVKRHRTRHEESD